ncbi:protein CpxP [Flavobacterium sp. PL11]|nr:protein CpxP [Flavobacterium sp. PL11]
MSNPCNFNTKKMKKLIIATLLFVGMTNYAQEQNEKPRRANMERITIEERQERQLKRLTADLNLDIQQQEQIKKLFADQEANREKQLNTINLSKEAIKLRREASRNKMQEDRKIMEDKIKTILNPAQFGTWKSNQDKMRERNETRMKERMENNRDN